MRHHFAALLTGAAILCAAPVVAQDMGTVLPNNYVLSDILNRQRVDAAIGSRSPAGRPAPARPAVPRTSGTPTASTSYRPSAKVSVRVRTQFAQWMAKQAGAEGGRKMAEAMARTDPVQNWARIVSGDGLRPGDLADSLAAYWIINWAMANGGDNDRAQAQAVRAQVRPLIADNPAFARLDNDQRQEMSEILMLNFLIQHAAYTDALQRKDSVTARRLGDAAEQRFRGEFGMELRRQRLTNAGFVSAR